MNHNNSQIAFAEVYDIIKHSNKEIQQKIPKKFIHLLTTNMAENYKVNIDYDKDISEQENIQHETKVMLGIIYRDFLCDVETKKKLFEKDRKELEKIEKEKQEKYSYNNLFKKSQEYTPIPEDKQIIEYKKDTWYNRIWNKIKSIFKK